MIRLRHFVFCATLKCDYLQYNITHLEKLARWGGGAMSGTEKERAAPVSGNWSNTGSIFFRTVRPLTDEGFPGENQVEN